MNKPLSATPLQAAAFARMQQLMTTSPVPSISTELLTTADGELNRELSAFLFDPPAIPICSKGKRIAICCANGVEEVEILGAHALALRAWRHGACGQPARSVNSRPLSACVSPDQQNPRARHPPDGKRGLDQDRHATWMRPRSVDYDALILPGGCWNPDALRADKDAAEFRARHACLAASPPAPSVMASG